MNKKKQSNLSQSLAKEGLRFAKVLGGSLLMGLVLNLLVDGGGLLPGGFAGLSLLIQRIGHEFFQVDIPFAVPNILLNAIPAYLAYRSIGKRFVLYSCLVILLSTVFIDVLPKHVFTQDMVLICVFGGVIYGFALSLILNANASSGGTDFIAMVLSNKYNIATWNYFLLLNAAIILCSGVLFGFEKALYTIIFQFLCTSVINRMHRRYQRKTIFFITSNPQEVAEELMALTKHGVTCFEGIGCYSGQKRYILYMVVEKEDVPVVKRYARSLGKKIFMNITDSEQLGGNFKLKPMD